MDRVYQSNAIETPPSSVASSGSYPTAGSKASGQLATVPGPYWFYSVTEEIRSAIVKAGLTPDAAKVNQLADALGKFLPLSGGSMSGAIKWSSTGFLQSTTTTGGIQIYGGTSFSDGALLGIYGKDHTSRAGWVYVNCTDGTNSKTLIGKPDGTLTWGDDSLLTSISQSINVSSAVEFSAGTWTATGNGLVVVGGYSSSWRGQEATLNGELIGKWYGKECGSTFCFPVKKGDVVVTTDKSSPEVYIRKFFPFN